jgi:acetyl-CoA acetyltransferase family protein
VPAVLNPALVLAWASASVAVLERRRSELDRINVFPVPDADTGTNLLLTMRSAVEAADGARADDADTVAIAAALARGALLGARGNSGVILSQVLRGFAEAVTAAQAAGHLAPGGGEVEALYDANGKAYALDDGVRSDASPESLAKLKPFFDRKYGNVTAGNSSQITDGAAWLLLASEEALNQHGLQPLGRIVDSEWAGLDPAQMGLGPVHAATPILERHGLGLNDLDYWEINEAFAAQVLGCLAAWKDEKYCREELGLDGAMGALDENKLNVDGGAIALGHPVGASGTRIVLHLLKTLKRTGKKRGMASICIGGGLGGAMLVEAL